MTRKAGIARMVVALAAIVTVVGIVSPAGATESPQQPAFGPNVLIFDPSMPLSQIQAAVDAVAAQQVNNQFGPQRYALLFLPGTYGSVANPLTFQMGYYTEVAGLGASPRDVTINGTINVYNRCLSATNCTALINFWRSLSNLTLHHLYNHDSRCFRVRAPIPWHRSARQLVTGNRPPGSNTHRKAPRAEGAVLSRAGATASNLVARH